MPGVEMTQLAADLSPRGMRERAFRRECELIARQDERKAQKVRERAGRLPLRSNHRRKLNARADGLLEHAAVMRAATGIASAVADLQANATEPEAA